MIDHLCYAPRERRNFSLRMPKWARKGLAKAGLGRLTPFWASKNPLKHGLEAAAAASTLLIPGVAPAIGGFIKGAGTLALKAGPFAGRAAMGAGRTIAKQVGAGLASNLPFTSSGASETYNETQPAGFNGVVPMVQEQAQSSNNNNLLLFGGLALVAVLLLKRR